jgi:8-oxo-dGTP diphosphatase
MQPLPYKISTLVYLHNRAGELLLMKRNKAPNAGLWSPIGGKLEMATGESPYEAAQREVAEEVGLEIGAADLHLFAMIAEKNYEDRCHWLMFLFDCRKPLDGLPPPIDEGSFGFFKEAEVLDLDLPETDRRALWKVYFRARHAFVALKADCSSQKLLRVDVDEAMELLRDGTNSGPGFTFAQ